MVDKRAFQELVLVGIISFFLFFISTNVSPQLGTIYQGLAVLGIGLTLVDVLLGKKTIFMINKSISWGKAIIIAGVAYLVLIFSSKLSIGLAEAIPLTEVLNLLGATAPIFSQSASINFMIFAIIIPIIETYVIFVAAIDIFATFFKIEPTRKNLFTPKLMAIVIIISLAFLLFHVNAKGVADEASLILVGIMGFISCILIIWFQEGRVAILFHILANTLASIALFAILGIT